MDLVTRLWKNAALGLFFTIFLHLQHQPGELGRLLGVAVIFAATAAATGLLLDAVQRRWPWPKRRKSYNGPA